jgi:hypothetical protein
MRRRYILTNSKQSTRSRTAVIFSLYTFPLSICVNGENRMEGLVYWSNYGGKAAYIHGGQGVLAGRLAGHDSYLTHPVTAL